ncbi:MAG: phosphatidylglycerophosphatase A [Zetaproteobacteria bacterium]|nr:phosphatidylglycerophosphatase A [Zetaproteobacteria bacterium]
MKNQILTEAAEGEHPQPAHVVPQQGWILHWTSVGWGLGLARFAPGTWGSLPGLVLGWGFAQCMLVYGALVTCALALCAVALAWGCIAYTERNWLPHDHKAIVVDEVVGQALAFLFLPPQVGSVVWAFVFFRLLDIWKPGWIGRLDRHGDSAWTTLADDLLAGLGAGVLVWGLLAVHARYPLGDLFALWGR